MYKHAEDSEILSPASKFFFLLLKLLGQAQFDAGSFLSYPLAWRMHAAALVACLLGVLGVSFYHRVDAISTVKEAVFFVKWINMVAGAVGVLVFSVFARGMVQNAFGFLVDIHRSVEAQGVRVSSELTSYLIILQVVALVAFVSVFTFYNNYDHGDGYDPVVVAANMWCRVSWAVTQYHLANMMLQLREYFLCLNSLLTSLSALPRGRKARRNNVVAPLAAVVLYQDRLSCARTKLRLLRRLHCKLCDAFDLINGYFSVPMLIVFSQTFTDITITLYLFIIRLFDCIYRKTGMGKLPETITMIIFIIWVFGMMIAACSFIAKEAARTGDILADVYTKLHKTEAAKEVKLFVMQHLHRKVTVTAYDFFDIDFSIVCSIAGAVTTYLIFLIQFQFMGPAATKHNATNTTLNYTGIANSTTFQD